MMRSFIREKKIYCGDRYMEVDIYPYTEFRKQRGKRSKKTKESIQVQKNLNDKNAKRKFVQLAETNFSEGDYVLHLTYNDENFPRSIEEMEKNIANYLRRLKRKRRAEGLEDLKYILVTSYTTKEDEEEGVESVRPHHHLLINGGIDRDVVEDLWRKRKRKGEKKGKIIGRANCRRLQYDEKTGVTAISQYLARNLTKKRKWTCSQNLERPYSRTNDSKYSRRKIEKICKNYFEKEYWEKQYEGWTVKDMTNGYEVVYNEFTGWSIYLKLRRKE